MSAVECIPERNVINFFPLTSTLDFKNWRRAACVFTASQAGIQQKDPPNNQPAKHAKSSMPPFSMDAHGWKRATTERQRNRDVISHDIINDLRISTNTVQMKVVTVDNCDWKLSSSFIHYSLHQLWIHHWCQRRIGRRIVDKRKRRPSISTWSFRQISRQRHQVSGGGRWRQNDYWRRSFRCRHRSRAPSRTSRITDMLQMQPWFD